MQVTRAAKPVDVAIGAKLKQLREDRNLTAAEVAYRVGTDKATANGWETGTIRISAAQLFTLSQMLGVTIGQFFEDIRAL